MTSGNSNHEFYILTKNEVSCAYSVSGNLEIKMRKKRTDAGEKMFIGISLSKKAHVVLFGSKLSTIYKNINEVFSIPFTKTILESLRNSGGNVVKNGVIINTPEQVKGVIIKFPAELRRIVSVPEFATLREMKKNPSISKEKYKSFGADIGVGVKNWTAIVSFGIGANAMNNPDEFLKKILDIGIKIVCYLSSREFDLDID